MSRCLSPVMLFAALAGRTVGPDALKGPGQRPSAGAVPVASVDRARWWIARGNRASQAGPSPALRRTGSLAGSDTRTGDLSSGAIVQGRQSRTALDEADSALATSTRREREHGVAEDAARGAVLYARGRYRAGLIDVRTLLDSERSPPSRRDGRATATVQLHKEPGGGWPGAPLPAIASRMRATLPLAEPVTRP